MDTRSLERGMVVQKRCVGGDFENGGAAFSSAHFSRRGTGSWDGKNFREETHCTSEIQQGRSAKTR